MMRVPSVAAATSMKPRTTMTAQLPIITKRYDLIPRMRSSLHNADGFLTKRVSMIVPFGSLTKRSGSIPVTRTP